MKYCYKVLSSSFIVFARSITDKCSKLLDKQWGDLYQLQNWTNISAISQKLLRGHLNNTRLEDANFYNIFLNNHKYLVLKWMKFVELHTQFQILYQQLWKIDEHFGTKAASKNIWMFFWHKTRKSCRNCHKEEKVSVKDKLHVPALIRLMCLVHSERWCESVFFFFCFSEMTSHDFLQWVETLPVCFWVNNTIEKCTSCFFIYCFISEYYT